VNLVKSIIIISRPLNCIITFVTVLAACYISSDKPNFNLVFISAFTGMLVNAGGNIINDYFDVENDKLNRPDRPLPSGSLTRQTALIVYIFFTAGALFFAYNINVNAFLIVVVTSVLLFIYSYKLKGVALAGNLVVAFLTGLAFFFGSIAVGNAFAGIIPALFAFLISLMREMVKDIEDIKGDEAIGLSTFPIRFGVNKSVRFIVVVGIILIAATIIPYLSGVYNLYYFIFVILSVNVILINIIVSLKKNVSETTLKRASKLLKLGMVLGIIAVFIGAKL